MLPLTVHGDGGMVWWYGVAVVCMVWCGGMVCGGGMMVWYGSMVWWYGVMVIWCGGDGGMVWWYGVVVWCGCMVLCGVVVW